MLVRRVLLVVTAVFLVSAGSFAVSPGTAGGPAPVDFDRTLTMGMTGVAVQEAHANGYAVPKVEAFYAGYRHVVGYYGVAAYAANDGDFGRPLAVYVTDYGGTDPTVTDAGYLRTDGDPGWVRAGDATFVVGSDARTPGGPAVVPFAARADAEAFRTAHGGRLLDWRTVRDRFGDANGADVRARMERRVDARHAGADRRVNATAAALDRPVSVVVGEDAPTLAAAIERAPPNTTVALPPGTYRGNVTVDEPLTLRGAGESTRVVGDGEGTALTVTAPGAAVSSLSVSGVGPNGTRPVANASAGSGWDGRIEATYGRGDAGIRLADADGALVDRVRIETPANGVLIRGSDGAVVRGVTVHGTDHWEEGFMGVLAMHSRVVVENSTFVGGRDGVYAHRADGSVVRDSRMTDLRYGVHEMYTSGTLVANTTVRGADVGLVVMTRPTGNALVGNDVRESEVGLSAAGSATYVAGNVLADNGYGLSVNARRSVYARNVVAGNEVGVRVDTVLPTNRVVDNDVVANGRAVASVGDVGPTHVWSAGGRGNYWSVERPDRDGDGVLDRPYSPSAPVDRRLATGPTARTLARAPAVAFLRGARSDVPGLRAPGVVDEAPRSRPVRPAVVRNVTDGVSA